MLTCGVCFFFCMDMWCMLMWHWSDNCAYRKRSQDRTCDVFSSSRTVLEHSTSLRTILLHANQNEDRRCNLLLKKLRRPRTQVRRVCWLHLARAHACRGQIPSPPSVFVFVLTIDLTPQQTTHATLKKKANDTRIRPPARRPCARLHAHELDSLSWVHGHTYMEERKGRVDAKQKSSDVLQWVHLVRKTRRGD